MPIDFRKPQYFKEFRFGSTLVWNIIKEIVVLTTVSGVSPLALMNAAAKEIQSLIQYGKCTTINDEIYCNNGKLVIAHRSGLPNGYTLLDSVGGSGQQWVITNVYLASTDIVECEFRNSTTTGFGAVYGIFKAGDSSALYGNQTYYSYDVSNNKVDTRISVNTNWHSSRHDFVNGTLTIDDTTVTFTPFEFENNTKNAVLSRYYNNIYGYGWKGYVRKFKVTRGNEVICDLLPCKNEQDIAGFYDLVTETFYSPTGGSLLEGDVVDDYELAIEGTAEVLAVSGTNIFNKADESSWGGYYVTTNDKIAEAASNLTAVIRCLPNTTYYGIHKNGRGGGRMFTVSSEEWTVGDIANEMQGSASIAANTVFSYTTQADAKWLFVCFGRSASGAPSFEEQAADFMLSLTPLSAATEYVGYSGLPQTTSVANLFAIGDVKDEQDLVSGIVTRRTKASITDGTITIQALAEPITEQVQKQSLSTVKGTNTVFVEAEIDDIPLEVKYYTVG